MIKNAVQRLQKIESDLNTVIHIYDVADKYKSENDRSEVPENECKRQSSLHNSFKKTFSFDSQCPQNVFPRKSRLMAKKPKSAPSSSGALFTIRESDYFGQPSSESIHSAEQQGVFTKKKSFENLIKLSNEFYSNDTSVGELPKAPSKSLQVAEEIITENKYTESTGDEDRCGSLSNESIPNGESTEDSSDLRNQDVKNNVNNSHSLKRNSEHGFTQKKELEDEIAGLERSLSVPSRKKISVQKEIKDWPDSSKFTLTEQTRPDSKKNKSSLGISSKHSVISTKITRQESPRIDIKEEKCNKNSRSGIKNLQEKTSKQGSNKTEKDDQSSKRINSDASSTNYLKEVKSKTFGRNGLKEKKVKFPLAPTECNNQKKSCKTSTQEDLESWMKEFSKIIEISNEKLEKMKFSKELALDIAKHLKNKYDEIQESKENLIQKVQGLEVRTNDFDRLLIYLLYWCNENKSVTTASEITASLKIKFSRRLKENEKLHREIKEVQQSKMKLQLEIEELMNSKTKLTEENTKTKSALEENIYLKTKICEMEKQYKEELLTKQKEIDQIQRERLIEIKNEIKSKETREEDFQRVKNEKAELQSQLNHRQSKTIILEEKIRQLQEELQNQKEHSRKKTERLEETNKELESIRLNSRDLEEQVKTLRKNIESFDEIQKNLLKQTAANDQQMKSNQEVIKKFQDENSKLKIELNNEKDGQLIKTKIIEDQQETIKTLREKSEEAKALVRKNQSLERILNIEREEKLELQEAVQHLKRRKEELKKKINSLESDLILTPPEVIQDLKKTQIVLHELENQVQIKQKEWELQLQTLLREKNQACVAAKFATTKLMQITKEFQMQSRELKRLQTELAENLAENEQNEREKNEKVTLTQSKQSFSFTRHDDQNSSWSKYRHQNDDDILMNWYFKNTSWREDV